jgi:hypothetical protein
VDKKLKVVPLSAEHIDYFFGNLAQVGEQALKPTLKKSNNQKLTKISLLRGKGVAILKDGRVIGGGGMFPHPVEDFGVVWSFISPELKRHKKFLFKTFRQFLAEFQHALGFDQLQTFVRKGDARDRQFVERLGFEEKDGGEIIEIGGLSYAVFVKFGGAGISQPQEIN